MSVARFVVVAASMITAIAGPLCAQQSFGRFEGEVIARFLRDGRNMQLEQPYSYIDPKGREWSVPKGTITDGASVPQFFWIAFPPFTGEYRAAAVIHDYYCQVKARSWQETHEVFYLASRAAGVKLATAKAMYGAVYNFGPRWGKGSPERGPGAMVYRTPEAQREYFDALEAWIEKENPSIEVIARRLDAGELPAKPN